MKAKGILQICLMMAILLGIAVYSLVRGSDAGLAPVS